MRRMTMRARLLTDATAILAGLAAVSVLASSDPATAQTASANSSFVVDPGVRSGSPGAGGPLPGLDATETAFFTAARTRFEEIDSVSGGIAGENGVGLGPRFNLNSCAGCHAQPAVGGTSPATNPQIAVATLASAKNTIPSFITLNGPVREARFVRNQDGTPDGGVHDLFVITGRSDAAGCNITQPNFAAALAQNNVIFRIPTPIFGLGLVENTPDSGLQSTAANLSGLRSAFGISGNFNTSGNDGTITRFGWKAQNKSLLIFAGEAYNVEQGVTNELFGNERDNTPGCQFNGTPEDNTNLIVTNPGPSPASDFSSDTVNFAAFMRLSAAPTPAPLTPAVARGGQVFLSVGCQGCHAVSQTTANSPFTGQGKVTFQPFSDFELHDMGDGLADGVSQGAATGEQFRTAPLWGIGQRIFFLHDGRTNNLITAILSHASAGSEANAVINAFNFLAPSDQQALITFLRAL
jgi:CxxC motif-containing protein (DUF1111 family)